MGSGSSNTQCTTLAGPKSRGTPPVLLMPRTKRWELAAINNGIGEVKLQAWKYFADFVYQEMLDYRQYIWRGQRCDNWKLEPTLDRKLSGLDANARQQRQRNHLSNFKYAVRGRRGPTPRDLPSEDEWWALGQHHGLQTPLLDWTTSPFAAAYFAFYSEGSPQTSRRAIYAVSSSALRKKSKELSAKHVGEERAPIVDLVRPMADDNPRLVNQSGLFTRSPDGIDLESWVAQHFEGERKAYVLMKLTVPDSNRKLVLRSLNRMNLNHLTLFPDVYGASRFCNIDLEIENY